jgi:hypothetical protein
MAADPGDEMSRVSNFLEEETLKEALPDLKGVDSKQSLSYNTQRPTAASLGIKEALSECLKESGWKYFCIQLPIECVV